MPRTFHKTNAERSTSFSDEVTNYKGMIVQRAVACFNMLPEHVKRGLTIDDLVQEGILFIGAKVLGNATGTRPAGWKKKKGSKSTLVYTAITNFYKNYATQLTCPKRGAITISYDADPLVIMGRGTYAKDRECNADELVSRMHQLASYELIRFLDQNFFTGECKVSVIRTRRFNSIRLEFQLLAHKTGVTIDIYRHVINKEATVRWRARQ